MSFSYPVGRSSPVRRMRSVKGVQQGSGRSAVVGTAHAADNERKDWVLPGSGRRLNAPIAVVASG
jgi:hypothetical protein